MIHIVRQHKIPINQPKCYNMCGKPSTYEVAACGNIMLMCEECILELYNSIEEAMEPEFVTVDLTPPGIP